MFELGAVGIPEVVNAGLLQGLMSDGYLPVISPVGSDSAKSGNGALNVNGDDAAASIATALGADELLFVADVEGVLSGVDVIDTVGLEEIEDLVEKGIVRGGMTAKLDAARTALAGGVGRVRISDLQGIGNEQRGTTVTATIKETR